MGTLDSGDVDDIVKAAIAAGLEDQRRLLMQWLPREMVAALPRHDDDASQLRSDVYELLHLEHDGAPALAVWLRNAAAQSSGQERAVFEAKLAALVPGSEAEAPRERGWRWFSTHESVEAGTPTVLAVLETFLASACYVWIASAIGSWAHFLIAALLGPFVLLRTSISQELGLQLIEAPDDVVDAVVSWAIDRWNDSRPISKLFMLPIHLVVYLAVGAFIALSALGVRVWATSRVVARRPIKSVRSIPSNWYRLVACTDLVELPELVPGGRDHVLDATDLVDFSYEDAITITAMVLLLPFVLVPALMFRWSIKGTAIIWLPILYAYQRFGVRLPIRRRVTEMRAGAFWRLLRRLSWGILACFAAKLLVVPVLDVAWEGAGWAKQLDVFVMHDRWHLWHIAGGANALLYLAVYYLYFEPAPGRMDDGVVKPRTVERVWTGFMLTRTALSLVTVGLGIWLTWQAVKLSPPNVTWWQW